MVEYYGLAKTVYPKPLLNSYKTKNNRLFALFLEDVRYTKIYPEYEKTPFHCFDHGDCLFPRVQDHGESRGSESSGKI
jgi:hypothetical protein